MEESSPERPGKRLTLSCRLPDEPEFELDSLNSEFQIQVTRTGQYALADPTPVLVEGERGSGKSVFAKYFHRCSPRRRRDFVVADLASLSESIMESELFGHIAGAFTGASEHRAGLFASAHSGTLFLDEIGKATEAVQKRLLRAIEERQVRPVGADRCVRADARIVTATNASLDELVERGTFLPDLNDRIGCFRIRIPPLNERREDIPLLVHRFIARHRVSFGYTGGRSPSVDPALMDVLCQWDWPGNVRELNQMVLLLLAHAEGTDVLTTRLCTAHANRLLCRPEEPRRLARSRPPLPATGSRAHSSAAAPPVPPHKVAQPNARSTRRGRPPARGDDAVIDAFGRVKNVSQLARALGVTRTTARRYLRRLGLVFKT